MKPKENLGPMEVRPQRPHPAGQRRDARLPDVARDAQARLLEPREQYSVRGQGTGARGASAASGSAGRATTAYRRGPVIPVRHVDSDGAGRVRARVRLESARL
jgi:hypothetical protein